MVHLKGEFKELMTPGSHIFNTDDYIYVTLTDEQDIPDAIGRLRILYPNIMKLDYDNTRTRNIMIHLMLILSKDRKTAN